MWNLFYRGEYYGGYKESDEMATRLVIDGNSVYEIDEMCETARRNGLRRMAEEKGKYRMESISGSEEHSEKIENETDEM